MGPRASSFTFGFTLSYPRTSVSFLLVLDEHGWLVDQFVSESTKEIHPFSTKRTPLAHIVSWKSSMTNVLPKRSPYIKGTSLYICTISQKVIPMDNVKKDRASGRFKPIGLFIHPHPRAHHLAATPWSSSREVRIRVSFLL